MNPIDAAGLGSSANTGNGSEGMRLSLSVRVAEAFDNKEKTTLGLGELIALAKKYGYAALCMRASQCGIESPPESVRQTRRRIEEAGLRVSMITGDYAVPGNNEQAPLLLRNIQPYLDLADALGSSLIRVCMKSGEDIEWARRACDEAAERNIRLAHQSHCCSLFETVQGSLDALQAVHRPNFGLIFEPANWLIAAEDYGRETIRRLAPWIFNVYIQNHRLHARGTTLVPTWTRGFVPLDHIGVWNKGGVDVDEVYEGLHAIGYKDFITVHQAFAGVMPVEEAVRRSAEFLGRYRAVNGSHS